MFLPLGFEASSFLMEKQLSSPNPLWQREETQLSNSCMGYFFKHSETAIVFGMLVLMSISIWGMQVSCVSRVLIPIPKKNASFVSTHMLKFGEQCKIARKTSFYEHV
jgi:hypothetical protein